MTGRTDLALPDLAKRSPPAQYKLAVSVSINMQTLPQVLSRVAAKVVGEAIGLG